MPNQDPLNDSAVLEAALAALEIQRQRIEEYISVVRDRLANQSSREAEEAYEPQPQEHDVPQLRPHWAAALAESEEDTNGNRRKPFGPTIQ